MITLTELREQHKVASRAAAKAETDAAAATLRYHDAYLARAPRRELEQLLVDRREKLLAAETAHIRKVRAASAYKALHSILLKTACEAAGEVDAA